MANVGLGGMLLIQIINSIIYCMAVIICHVRERLPARTCKTGHAPPSRHPPRSSARHGATTLTSGLVHARYASCGLNALAQYHCPLQMLPPAPPHHCPHGHASKDIPAAAPCCCPLRPRTTPFPEKNSILRAIYGVLLWAVMIAATPLGAWGRGGAV